MFQNAIFGGCGAGNTSCVDFSTNRIHETRDKISFEGFTLKKGLLLIGNLYYAHYDKSVWNDPENFRPERFLLETDNGDVKINEKLKECVLAFQPGKRNCPGDHVAKDILFIFAAKLVQKFNFSPDPARSRKDYTTPDGGIILSPPKIELVVTPRT